MGRLSDKIILKIGVKSQMKFTGERLVPGNSPAILEAAHRARYEFAASFCNGKRVLDLGCGNGYGSVMLAKVAAYVLGIDISKETIKYAKNLYKASNLHFQVGDISNINELDKNFEIIICFEVIEHLDDPGKALSYMSSLFPPGGRLILSTPNGLDSANPFHVHGWNKEEFVNLISKHFSVKELLGQGASKKVKDYRQNISKVLQTTERRVEEIKRSNPLVRYIPGSTRRWLYKKMVQRKFPSESNWELEDFPIGPVNEESEILIAICQLLKD